ncbi:hypothetical protein E2C01_033039 [Portunus trituberculatus]|uniref:Uncharacterized protein n=1 Tax=Portunus trituberculatus TaxID=210409 RepID=A0A5B7EZ37_PORTR|nr:hypothetical protein [Portunus trituberculatus]
MNMKMRHGAQGVKWSVCRKTVLNTRLVVSVVLEKLLS